VIPTGPGTAIPETAGAGAVDAVCFRDRAGRALYGILHRPVRDVAPGTVVVILSPGIKNRVAPHRLYVKMSRYLADRGFTVFRFDCHGLGDSEGEVSEKFLADLYGSIQVGRYVADTHDAMDWLQREHGARRFVLSGLCGGAITGLLAARRDPRADGILALGIPVILDGTKFREQKSKFLTEGELELYRTAYLRKLFDPKSWLRLVTLRTDLRALRRAMLGPLRRRFSARKTDADAPAGAGPGAASGDSAENMNPHFREAFETFLESSRRMILIFGEYDRLFWEYDEKFLLGDRDRYGRHGDRYELYLVPEARHIFELPETQADMLRKAHEWLGRHYGPSAG